MSLKNIPILWKIVLILAVFAFVSLGGTYISSTTLSETTDEFSTLVKSYDAGLEDTTRAEFWVGQLDRGIYLAITAVTDETNAAAEAEQQLAIKEATAFFARAISESPELAPQIEPLQRAFKEIATTTCRKSMEMANTAKTPEENEAASKEMAAHCEPQFQKLIEQFKGLIASATKVAADRTDVLIAASRSHNWTQAVVISVATLITLALAVLTSISGITTPLARVIADLERIGEGELNTSIRGTDRKDEIGQVARSLDVFRYGLAEAAQLREQTVVQERAASEKLKAERARIADEFQRKMGGLADAFARSSGDVSSAARNLSATAEETSRQAQAVSGAAEEASANVQTVAASTEEMTASVREIASQVAKSHAIANSAAAEAQRTEVDVRALSEAATKIGEVVELINNIAGQTNLLALNATIEAARAGEAGKGFAVVASEVKQLAAQTAKATEEISSKINEIQTATNRTVGSIDRIVTTVSDIQTISTMISAAIEEQGAATSEIASNTQRAARGTGSVSDNINGVGRAAEMTGAASSELMNLSTHLADQAKSLQQEVVEFVETLRAG